MKFRIAAARNSLCLPSIVFYHEGADEIFRVVEVGIETLPYRNGERVDLQAVAAAILPGLAELYEGRA